MNTSDLEMIWRKQSLQAPDVEKISLIVDTIGADDRKFRSTIWWRDTQIRLLRSVLWWYLLPVAIAYVAFLAERTHLPIKFAQLSLNVILVLLIVLGIYLLNR